MSKLVDLLGDTATFVDENRSRCERHRGVTCHAYIMS